MYDQKYNHKLIMSLIYAPKKVISILDIINRTRFGNANKVVDRTAYFIELGRQNNHLLYQDV